MKSCVLCVLLIIASFLTCKGQTRLFNDKEVIVDIDTYRKLRYKYYFSDTAIASRDSLLAIKDSSLVNKSRELQNCQNTLVVKDQTIAGYSKTLDNAIKQIVPPKKFSLSSTVFGFSIGFGVGAIVTAILIEKENH